MMAKVSGCFPFLSVLPFFLPFWGERKGFRRVAVPNG